MTREEKIARVKRVISNKVRSNGCKILVPWFEGERGQVELTIFHAKPDASSGSAYIEDGKVIYPQIGTADMSQGELLFYQEGGRTMSQITSEALKKEYNLSFNEFISKHVVTIGHDVMLGDFLDWVRKNEKKLQGATWCGEHCGFILDGGLFAHITIERKEMTKPIQDQPDKCVDFLDSIIPND